MRVTKSVETVVLYRGEPRTAHVGIATVDRKGMHMTLFGLCQFSAPDYLTHMCYYLDDKYFNPATIAADTQRDWFFFDAGTTCAEIRISRQELIRSFVALGLIPNPTVESLTEYRLLYKINGEWSVKASILCDTKEELRTMYNEESPTYTVKPVEVTITEVKFNDE